MTSLYNEACSEYDKRNYSVAFDAFYTLALEHDVSCQMNVANMLLHGIGTAKNVEKAHEWYKQAAYNDDRQAQHIYGWDCIDNENDEEGLKYIELSSNAGYTDAISDLAAFYVHGIHSCDKDMKKASKLYEKAVLLGKSEAMQELLYTKSIEIGKVRTTLYFLKNIFRFAKALGVKQDLGT